MNPAVLALATRTLNISAKSLGWHLSIGGLVTLTLAALLRVFQLQSLLSAPGLEFMQWSAELNLLVTTLAGIGLFATSISAERESGTLDLLRLAGLGSTGIIAARWLPLLVSCSVFLLVQIPFALFGVPLGGVTPAQVIAVYFAMWLHLVVVASIGLWVSVHCRTSMGSVLTAIALLGFWGLGPQVLLPLLTLVGGLSLTIASEILAVYDLIESMGTVTGFGRVTDILRAGNPSPGWWDWPDLWQVGLSGVAIVWAWASLESAASHDSALYSKTTTGSRKRRHSWRCAVLWKDFFLVEGGWRGMLARVVLYPLVGWMYYGDWYPSRLYDPAMHMLGWDGAILLAQVYQREFRDNTWDSLRLSSGSTVHICYEKLASVAFALLPGVIWVTLTMPYFQFNYQFKYEHWGCCSLLLLGWHVTALFSVLFPQLIWVVAFLVGVITATVEFELVASMLISSIDPHPIELGFILFHLVVCVILHTLTAVRIHRLSE